MGRSILRNSPVLRARSLSPKERFLWKDSANEYIEHKNRQGWYRMEYGDGKDPMMWYLPKFSDRTKFLEHRMKRDALELKEFPRALSVPPSEAAGTVMVIKERATTPTSLVTKKPKYPYQKPSDNSLTDIFHPTLGPYYGRGWSLPDYLNPIAGRDRALSSPVHIISGWTDWKAYEQPFSSFTSNTIIKPESTEVEVIRKSVVPARTFYSYSPSVETRLAIEKANRSVRMAVHYDCPPLPKIEAPPTRRVEVIEKSAPVSYSYTVIPHDVTSTSYYLNCSCWTDPRVGTDATMSQGPRSMALAVI